jgi:hypothetical protein
MSPTRNRKLNSHHPQSPMWVEGIHTMGAAWCPKGIDCDTTITTSMPCSPRHNTSHFGFGGPEPRSPFGDVTRPPATRTPTAGFWRGCQISCVSPSSMMSIQSITKIMCICTCAKNNW